MQVNQPIRNITIDGIFANQPECAYDRSDDEINPPGIVCIGCVGTVAGVSGSRAVASANRICVYALVEDSRLADGSYLGVS
jgi:hypothetical protein